MKRRHVRYPYGLLSPLWLERPAGEVATVIVQSLSGGIFEGENLAQRIVVEAGAQACITNQAATVVHTMPGGGQAEQAVALTVGEGAYLEFRPQPLVLFPGSRLRQVVTIETAVTASLVVCDGFLGHDPLARGRTFDLLDSALKIRDQNGRLLVADRMRVSGRHAFDGAPGISRAVGAHGWMAALAPLSLTAMEDLRGQIAAGLCELDGVYAGVCTLRHGGVFVRVAAGSAGCTRRALQAALATVRRQILGSLPSPRLP